jgi:hypothetical protein
MKKVLNWMLRGGITAALFLLILSVRPARAVEQTQSFELGTAEITPATVRFRAPEKMYRGQQAEFSVSLDVDALLTDEDVHPVMVYRLELDGAELVPDAVFQIPLAGVPHQEARWGVRLPDAGTYNGTWWVYVEYVSGSELMERQALFARRFSVKSHEILGMSVNGVRWVSMIVILFGLSFELWFSLRKRRGA